MLKNHIGKIHSTVNCDICDKIVVKSALSNHTQTHQERKFQCESCDNVYTRKDSLAKHIKTCGADIVRVRKELAKVFRCDTCEKTFTKNAYLKQHTRTHALRKTVGEYGCNFCDKIYTSNQYLGKHIQNTHPNPRRVEDANVGFLVFDSPLPPLKVREARAYQNG